MNTAERVLRDLLEQQAIGAAKISGAFSRMADLYGEPTEKVDPKGYGFDERCRIWNYDEVQVWSNANGTIDRVFFKTNSEQRECQNQNFVNDMTAIREKLKDCNVEMFERVLGDGSSKIRRRSNSTEFTVRGTGIEVFATFVASGLDGPHCLSMLRLNAVPDPNAESSI